jgi:G protein-coupled receptor 158
MKLHSAVLSNGELDIADINLADMDPEEIRSELRRIYTQFQILKNKTMRKDNPHISKRRGGRKGTHRRFSLQPFSHKPSSSSIHHHHHHTSGHGKSAAHEYDETEVSRTPEESTASVEGNQVADAGTSSARKSSGITDDGKDTRKRSDMDAAPDAASGSKSRF